MLLNFHTGWAFFGRNRVDEWCWRSWCLDTFWEIPRAWTLICLVMEVLVYAVILENPVRRSPIGHLHVPKPRVILGWQCHWLMPWHHHLGLLCLHLYLSILPAPVFEACSLPFAGTRQVWRARIVVLNFIITARATTCIHVAPYRMSRSDWRVYMARSLVSHHLCQLLIMSHALP